VDRQLEKNCQILNRYVELFRISENPGLIAVMMFCLLKCGKEVRFIVSDSFSHELECYSVRIRSLGLAEAVRPYLQGEYQHIFFERTIASRIIFLPPDKLKTMAREIDLAKNEITKLPTDSNRRVKFDDLVSRLCRLAVTSGSDAST